MQSVILNKYRTLIDKESRRKELTKKIKRRENIDRVSLRDEIDDNFFYYSSYEFFIENEVRKKTGAFYTPEWVVAMMVDMALDKWCENNAGHDLWSIKVCDPACGSGNFTEVLARALIQRMAAVYPDVGLEAITRHVLESCVYAYDINADSVGVAEMRMYDVFGYRLLNLECKDTLFESEEGGFDIIIGNPPYGNLLTKEQKALINDQHKNIALTFIDWGLSKLNPKGELCFIVPHTFTRIKGCVEWRRKMKESGSLHTVVDMGNPFYDIFLEEVVFMFNNDFNEEILSFSLKDKEYCETIHISDFYNESHDFKMMMYWSPFFVDMNRFAKSKPFSGRRGVDILKNLLLTEDDGQCYKFILGRNITKDGLKAISGYDRFIPKNSDLIRDSFIINEDVVAITQFGQNLKAAVLDADCYPSGGVVVVKGSGLSNDQIIAYLNDPRINYYLKRFVFNNADSLVHIDGVYLQEIPYVDIEVLDELWDKYDLTLGDISE